jgi:hypothetical protein
MMSSRFNLMRLNFLEEVQEEHAYLKVNSTEDKLPLRDF